MKKYLYYLKLWYWWNFTIKRNEFSRKIDLFYCKGDRTKLMYQRDIAHKLDSGIKITDMPYKVIKKYL